jgi:hypothetical protein
MIRNGLVAVLCLIVMVACSNPPGAPTPDTSAASLIPNLPDYHISTTNDLQTAITTIAGSAALSAGRVETAALVTAVNGIAQCYQRLGAYEGRTFINKTDPLMSGALVIFNQSVITSPDAFAECMPISAMARSAAPQPCANFYTLNKNNTTYYIAYAATDASVCNALCSALEGCAG